MFGLSAQELLIVGIVAVILFGKRLPDVARSLGGTYRDFRKGLAELQSTVDVRDAFYAPARHSSSSRTALPNYADDNDRYDQPTAPKFELPAAGEPSSEPGSNAV